MNNFHNQQRQQQVIGHSSMALPQAHGAPPPTAMMSGYLFPNQTAEQAYLMQQQATHNRGFIQSSNRVGLSSSAQLNSPSNPNNTVGKQKTGRKLKKALVTAAATSMNPSQFQIPPHATVMHSQNPQMFNQNRASSYGNMYMPPTPSPQASTTQQQMLQQHQRWLPLDPSQTNYRHSEPHAATHQTFPLANPTNPLANMPLPAQPANNFLGVHSSPQQVLSAKSMYLKNYFFLDVL